MKICALVKVTMIVLFALLFAIPRTQAAPVVLVQDESFYLDEYGRVSRWGINQNGVKTFDVHNFSQVRDFAFDFVGAPGTFMLGGKNWTLDEVRFRIDGKLHYDVDGLCKDSSFFSDCLTKAEYDMDHVISFDGITVPGDDVPSTLTEDYTYIHLHASDVTDVWERYGKDHRYDFQLDFSRSADMYDLAFLDVTGYTVHLSRLLDMRMLDWDSNDTDNHLQIVDYLWEGTFSVEYAYSENVIPLPGALWMLGSGLLGLIGFVRRR